MRRLAESSKKEKAQQRDASINEGNFSEEVEPRKEKGGLSTQGHKRTWYNTLSETEKAKYIRKQVEDKKNRKKNQLNTSIEDIDGTQLSNGYYTKETSSKRGRKRDWYQSLTETKKTKYIKKQVEARKKKMKIINTSAEDVEKAPSERGKPKKVPWLLRAVMVATEGEGEMTYEPILSEPHELEKLSPCDLCGAKRFQYEPPGFCCQGGKVSLKNEVVCEELYSLFTSDTEEGVHFRKNIRALNSIFAFTSFGVTIDGDLASSKNGVYTFKAQGQVYHSLPSILPTKDGPEYFQLYIYDPENEVENRMNIVRDAHLKKKVVEKLKELLEVNPYAQFFRSLKEYPTLDNFQIGIRKDVKLDQRVYNSPTTDQVAAIWIEGNDPDGPLQRDIVVEAHAGKRYKVKHYFGCYDPLQYPLLFPNGEIGWHQQIEQRNMTQNVPNFSNAEDVFVQEEPAVRKQGNKRVTCRQYYCYKFQDRDSECSLLLLARRLLQQYAVDMYIKLESTRLDFFRSQQKNIRSELYQGIVDSVTAGETEGSQVGRRIVLPPSFVGGPRDMRRRYLDAMALVQRFGKPDLFITMTCNPEWKEIEDNLKGDQTPQDRPELVTRVFRAKLQDLKDQLMKKKIFGEVAAHVHVIEFQKRGLPHAHILIILKKEFKITSPDQYDKYVWAEIPDEDKYPRLYEMVLKHMMHGPCGDLKKKNFCMVDGKCKSHYPRNFCQKSMCGKDGYPLYRRRDDGKKALVRKAELDNKWVVPYNPYLLSRYNCHINVEICSGMKAVKYLYKYIYKGHDRVAVSISHEENGEQVDEIKQFQDGRWVSAQEAMWRIFEFNLNEMSPCVINLQLHLPGKHLVSYWGNTNLENLVDNDYYKKTMLTEFFNMHATKQVVEPLLYRDFPEHYTWNKKTKTWSKRETREVIGRVNGANPREGERYYLRLLLNHIKGPTSFEDLLTVDGKQCKTFKESAQKKGYLESDNSIYECLTEAITFHMPYALRLLFATILVHCEPVDVRSLWDTFLEPMSDDFTKDREISEDLRSSKTLKSLKYFLESMGRNIADYDLPNITVEHINESTYDGIKEVEEERLVQTPPDDIDAEAKLNTEQKKAFKAILERVNSQKGGVFFIDGPGGTGKTFLYRALLAHLRSRGMIALATASSGVAAALMPGGRTAHSRFKIPISVNESSTCNISKQKGTAVLLQQASLIIWDEAPMAKRFSIEAVDRTMKDILNSNQDFGGKVIVFGGDFRQVLPVITRATREQTVNASLVKSHLWSRMEKFTLTKNMRARGDQQFGEFLLRVGNGTEPADKDDMICIPNEMVIDTDGEEDPEQLLINNIYPSLQENAYSSEYITGRAILAAKNDCVDKLNGKMISLFPGKEYTYNSFDEAVDDTHHYYQEEFLNTLTPNGLPPHRLVLKKNCPIMLLRNLDPANGLCNGTRMVCRGFTSKIIHAEIAMGQHAGKEILIPRIPLSPAEDEGYPFQFRRKQFPVRLCFAMTINKSQGQTIPHVGLYLPDHVFSHGQLYVALSRGVSMSSTKVLIKSNVSRKQKENYTKNIVYKEIFPSTLNEDNH